MTITINNFLLYCLKKVSLVRNCSRSFGERTIVKGGGVAHWLGRRISDQGVSGSNPGRCTFRCGLEQVTFTLLSTG